MMGFALNQVLHGSGELQPVGMGSPMVAPYGAYPTADGHTAILGTTSDREWRRLARDVLAAPISPRTRGTPTTATGSGTGPNSTRSSAAGARSTTWPKSSAAPTTPGSATPA